MHFLAIFENNQDRISGHLIGKDVDCVQGLDNLKLCYTPKV